MWPQYNRCLRDVVAAMTDEQLTIPRERPSRALSLSARRAIFRNLSRS